MNAIYNAGLVLAAEGAEFTYLFDLTGQLLHDAILMIIAVFTLFLIASHFLFNPVRDMMNKRQEKIKDELDSAQKSMEDADALKAEYEGKLKDIDKEAESILSDARKRALDNESKIVAAAKEEAAAIINQARIEAQLEKQKAADDMKKEMISIASLLAGKVTAGAIDTSIQDSLVEETLKEIGETTWQS